MPAASSACRGCFTSLHYLSADPRRPRQASSYRPGRCNAPAPLVFLPHRSAQTPLLATWTNNHATTGPKPVRRHLPVARAFTLLASLLNPVSATVPTVLGKNYLGLVWHHFCSTGQKGFQRRPPRPLFLLRTMRTHTLPEHLPRNRPRFFCCPGRDPDATPYDMLQHAR